MKRIICFLLLSFLLTSLFAQSPEFEWAKQFGGEGPGQGIGVAVDSAGNVYTTGSFTGTFDFDPGPDIFNITASDQRDIFISKLDADGNFL